MTELTDKERRMLDYITATIRENGYSPSVRDIRNALGIKSTSTVHVYLERLEKKGFLQKENAKSRTLRVEGVNPDVSKVPLVGRVTAGTPILAEENLEGYVTFSMPGAHSSDPSLFALRVTGTSMIGAGILDGDIVIVRRESSAENGEIVVALIDDEATVKTFYKENGHYRLQPENPTMKPMIFDDLLILGKVVASVRYYR